ncbi:MAG: hypothetical protein ABIT36_11230, partial [Steroidobacteraceae bacterium]
MTAIKSVRNSLLVSASVALLLSACASGNSGGAGTEPPGSLPGPPSVPTGMPSLPDAGSGSDKSGS